MEDEELVVCYECQHEYMSEFDEDTGMSTTQCPTCGHDQRDYGMYN
jgi:DNA-directed RNA polymerase subunit RPC12/RpoP